MSKKIGKKILITGGAGFIGSSLILSLQDKYEIICLDCGNNYPEFKKLVNNKVKLVKGDITNEILLDNIVKNCQTIIHLAGGGGNSACIRDPIWAINTHILGTHLLLKKALKYKIEKFIFASSQAVYTTFHQRTIPLEEKVRLEPDDFYGTLKKIAEDMICNGVVDYSILRLANIYGSPEFFPLQDGGAINNFIKSVFKGEKLQIYGSGSQGIDYIHIKDLVKAITLVLEKKSKNNVYNIGSGELVQIEKIAKIISDISKDRINQDVKAQKILVSADKIWPDRLMSIKKIKKDLNWKPEISLKVGLEEMINNYLTKK